MKKANYKLLYGKLPSFDENTSLVVFWNEAIPEVSLVLNNLLKTISAKPFCSFCPISFHSIDGAVVYNNVASSPEITFWHSEERKDIVILTSAQPQLEHFRFFTDILDFAEKKCNVKTVYTVGSIYEVCPHKAPRKLTAIYNNSEIKSTFKEILLSSEVDIVDKGYPARPSMSAFFAWACRKRNLPSINLWVSMPFYMANIGDPMGQRAISGTLEKLLNLNFDYTLTDGLIRQQYSRLDLLCERSLDAGELVERISEGDLISEEETAILMNEINEFFSNAVDG